MTVCMSESYAIMGKIEKHYYSQRPYLRSILGTAVTPFISIGETLTEVTSRPVKFPYIGGSLSDVRSRRRFRNRRGSSSPCKQFLSGDTRPTTLTHFSVNLDDLVNRDQHPLFSCLLYVILKKSFRLLYWFMTKKLFSRKKRVSSFSNV